MTDSRLVRWFALALAAVFIWLGPILAPIARAQETDVPAQVRQVLVLTRLPLDIAQRGGSYASGIDQNAERRGARQIARQYGLTLVDDWPLPLVALDCFVMAVPEGRTIEAIARQLSDDPRVAFAEPMHFYRTQGAVPSYNDPLFQAEPATKVWRLTDLHRLSTGRRVSVAIIDSGIESNHPDLAGQISFDRNFVSGRPNAAEPHGTGVAGVIAARSGNAVGIVGIAPHARLMALRACWQETGSTAAICDALSLAKALYFAIESKARIINLSLSGPSDFLLSELLQVGLVHGTTIVAAYDSSASEGGFPASFPGVIAVSDDPLIAQRAGVYFAPGRNVITTQPGGRWNMVSGSSYSAAHVSGLLALVRAAQTKKDIRPQLIAGRSTGGTIDACATLSRASGSCACDCADADGLAAKPRR